MRIAIDARLNAYRQGGIPQYTRQLVTALADVAAEDQIVSFQHRDQLRPLAIAPNVLRRTAFTPPHHRFEQWTLPLEVLLARPDVLHCPDFIAPTRRACPAVVTIHDLAFMHYPEILDVSARAYYSQVTSNAPRADAIIAVSESTRQDIAQFLDIPIEQIDVIHEAAAPLYAQIDLREGEARVLNSTPVAADTFMLFVSTLEPRKNLPTLLQALRICIDRRPDAGYRLVIVGRRGWRDEAIFQTARDLKLADHVLFTGNVGQYDLRWLYNACRLYINPSLYEGFGLPLLEAMACGAPCLAAATSSLPEIGGDAAIYVPPLEAEQWADEIMALWDDEDRRAELGRMGVARAQQFSWNRAARETLKVYRRAVERIVPRAEPLPSARYSQPPEPFAANGLSALGLNAPRPCLRCGTALQPGDLQLGVSMRAADFDHTGQLVAPRIWSCPRCGYVELVNETHHDAHHEVTAASMGHPAPALVADADASSGLAEVDPLVAPVLHEEALSEQLVLSEADADASSGLAEVDPLVAPALPEETFSERPGPALVADADASSGLAEVEPLVAPALPEEALSEQLVSSEADADASTELVDASMEMPAAPSDDPASLEDEPVVSAELAEAELAEAPAALENPLAEVPARLDEDLVSAAALAEPDVFDAAAPNQVAHPDDAAVSEAALVEPEGMNGSAAPEDMPETRAPLFVDASALEGGADALEARAVASAELSDAAIGTITPAAHDQAEPSDATPPESSAPTSATGTAQGAHSPSSSNGTVLKGRSGRGSRRQPPGAEPAAKQPAKRRSGGSKRKQTT